MIVENVRLRCVNFIISFACRFVVIIVSIIRWPRAHTSHRVSWPRIHESAIAFFVVEGRRVGGRTVSNARRIEADGA